MGRIHQTVWLLLGIVLSGCGRGPGAPTKEVEVPDGGPPVLTSAERAAREYQASKRVPGAVAPAMFQQPLEEPQPLKPLTQWTEQEVAADALGRIGPAAVPALVQALQSPDANVRLKAVEVLGRMGAEATDAVPQLIKLLDDPDPAVRKAAARTLGLVGPAAKDAVPALIRALLQPTSP